MAAMADELKPVYLLASSDRLSIAIIQGTKPA